jgi:two-component system, NtrC family, sensor kinase
MNRIVVRGEENQLDGAHTSGSATPHQYAPMVAAEKALRERPAFSVRTQVGLSVLLLFAIVVVLGLLTFATTSRVQQETHLFETTSKLLFEIDQARRFEKNFFEHGTNLDDALEQVHSAKRILRENSDRISAMAGTENCTKILDRLQQYEASLNSLTSMRSPEDIRSAETNVREHGRETDNLATELVQKEQAELERMISFSRRTQLYLIVFLLLYMMAMSYGFVRRIVEPIGRYMEYLARIARGDYSPILPKRRFRDEFSALALAINHMLEELVRRESILVESHRLRAVGTLTAGIAHELNNPINNITLTSHMLREDYADLSDDERREMIEDIIQQAERTKKIVTSLLDFARKSESNIEPLDLSEVVKSTLSLAQNQLKLKGVGIRLDIAPHLPPIHGDAQQLSQVVLNLVLNAIDVSPKGGRIDLSVSRASEDGFVEIQVRDYGSGIPDHILPLIFDPFFTTKAKGKGTGMGLSICKGIVSKHGGEIAVDTELGRGTTFSVRLPVTSLPLDFTEVRHELEKRAQ